jgi:hypothetical protein
MRKLLVLALIAAIAAALPVRAADAPRKKAPGAAEPRPLSAEEREACGAELDVLEKRLKLFEGQGLPRAEIQKRNAGPQAALEECARTFRLRRAAERAREADLAELDRRAGPEASDQVRSQIWTQLRLERLSVKPVAELTEEERAELQAGSRAELAETHATLDTAHSRDPAFMRMVQSSLACYHGVRRDRIKDDLRHEEALLKLGKGDRQKTYVLKSDLRQSEEVLSRAREAGKGYKDGLGRCTEEKVAVLAHCLAIRFEEQGQEPACESEEIQQYIRFIK